LPAFMTELRTRTGTAFRALEFLILSCARTSEALGADWSEIDLKARVWIVPASRMKSGREHRVPLSDAAVALLGAMPTPHSGLVFAGTEAGSPIGKMVLPRLMDSIGKGAFTIHGFRASFSTWGNEATSFPAEVIEAALAHLTGTHVGRAYARGDMFERRVRLMQTWATFCNGAAQPTVEVIELRRPA
jgi:integrase